MGFLSGTFAKIDSLPGAHEDFWYQPVNGGNVTAGNVLGIPMVYACVRVLAETLAQVPLSVYEDRGDQGKEKARSHPLQGLLHKQPNPWQTSFEWREMMMGHAVLRGNAYSYLRPGPRGPVDQIIPLHPDRMADIQLDPSKGKLIYRYNDARQGTIYFPGDRILHIRGLSGDGIKGYGVVEIARSMFQLSKNLTDHAATFIQNAARPGGVVQHPSFFKDDEGKKKFKADWREFANGKIGDVAVLEHGMQWTQLGMTQEDAQFLQTLQEVDVNLARLFRIPLHLVQDLRRATFNNIEHQSLDFVIFTMTPWFVRWEQAMDRDMIIAKNRYFTRFNVNGLLRGATADRFNAYQIAIQSGFMTRQEVRILEDMNPEPSQGQLMVPMNMAPEGDPRLGDGGAARARAVLLGACEREVRREIKALRAAIKTAGETGKFNPLPVYEGAAERIAENLSVDVGKASDWVGQSIAALDAAGNFDAIVKIVDAWEISKAATMADMFAYETEDE